MKQRLIRAGLAAVLAALVLTVSVRPAPAQEPTPGQILDRLDQMDRANKDLQKQVQDQQEQLKRQKETLDKLGVAGKAGTAAKGEKVPAKFEMEATLITKANLSSARAQELLKPNVK